MEQILRNAPSLISSLCQHYEVYLHKPNLNVQKPTTQPGFLGDAIQHKMYEALSV